MKPVALWLLPMTLCAGPARYARVGDFEGTVQVQLQAADDWQAARRNLPLRELSWLRTEGPSRVEVELDEGSVLRLGPDSLVELSDYTRLSTGQRITLVSLDHGVAYFTGAAEGKDALMVAVPGAQVTIRQGARLRLEARDPWSLIAAMDGVARFSSPTAEFDLDGRPDGEAGPRRIRRASSSIARSRRSIPTAGANERDKVLLSSTSAAHVPGLRYGLADLDAYGVWIQSGRFRRRLETQSAGRLGALPQRQMGLVRRPRLHLDQRRSVGLAALSLRPLDATGGHRLDLGARRKRGVQAGRGVLAEERQAGGLGRAGARRKLEAAGCRRACI